MNDQSGLYYGGPEGTCPVCPLREVAGWQTAVQAVVPLNLLQNGACPLCLRWLSAQTGELDNGSLTFPCHSRSEVTNNVSTA